jgi:hypothetical protein
VLADHRAGFFVAHSPEEPEIVRRADVAQHDGAFRLSSRSFARFIGELLNAAENSSCVICRRFRAS